MISSLRRILVESWLGRVIAIVVFAAFIGWGVGDVIGYMGTSPNVAAQVGESDVTAPDLAAALRQEVPTVAQQMGLSDASQLSPAMLQQVARQILQRLTGQAELLNAAHTMKVVVPDEAIRKEIFSLPYFRGSNGQFDRALFNQKLRAQGLTEQRVIQIVRDDLTARTLLQPIAQSGSASEILIQKLVQYGARTRMVDFVTIPFENVPQPATADETTLRRYYANHPWLFRTAEQRHARIVVLSPDTVAQNIPVDEKQLRRIYDEQNSRFNTPETRDLQLITLPDAAQAQAVRAAWQRSGSWQEAQQAAKGAAAVEMPATRASAIPSEALRGAIFQAQAGQVSPVIQTENGSAVFRVTKVTPARSTSYEQAKPDILAEYRKAIAPSLITDRRRTLQDAIAGKGLDAIPDTLGAVAAAGSLDAHGITAEGQPAPLPASGALREAIIHQVFTQKEGAAPYLVEGPDNGWFAVDVDKVSPASPRSFEQARADVLKAWQADNRRQAANQQATTLYIASKASGTIAPTASAKGQVTRNVPLSLASANQAIPAELAPQLARMQAGQAIMAENDHAFFVAVVTKVFTPDPPMSATNMQKLKSALAQADSEDLVAAFIDALAARTPPRINPTGITSALDIAGLGEARQ